jgi:hypothetical protein
MTDREKWIGGKGYYKHSSGLVHLSRPLHTQSGRRIAGSDHWFVYETRIAQKGLPIAGPLTLREAKVRGSRAVRDIIMRRMAANASPAIATDAVVEAI